MVKKYYSINTVTHYCLHSQPVVSFLNMKILGYICSEDTVRTPERFLIFCVLLDISNTWA